MTILQSSALPVSACGFLKTARLVRVEFKEVKRTCSHFIVFRMCLEYVVPTMAHANKHLAFVHPGVVVTQLSATDADSGSNGWLMYRLESGAQDRFVVDSLSGAVLVGNTTLDREERASYRLVVMATDRGTPPLSGTATLTVILDDVNDSRPRFIEPVTMINVNESTPPGVVVATLTAEDPDLNPRLEYYIISVEAKDDGNKPVNGLQQSFGIDLHTGETFSDDQKCILFDD